MEQGRAEFAYNCAKEGSEIRKKKEYKSYAKKIPALIQANGLGATFAYIKSKTDEDKSKAGYAYKLLYDQVTEWLKKEPKGLIVDKLNNEKEDLVKIIVSLNSAEYRALTREVLSFFLWLRRFAEGLIEGE
ncbi:MAG: type III-B CRISPR module-associated protein Cmr5 [Firmicutes bacterium]|nr:type III-B CRISPR module-associated protein Cmr5 [Bacillota bacterium]